MFRLASEDGKIERVPKIRLLKEPSARQGFLENEEFDRLLKHLPEHLRPLISFLYYTAVRLGEALDITWSQVDPEENCIRLEAEQTKSGAPRMIPIPDPVLPMLKRGEPTARVFDATNLRKAWKKACVAAGLGQFIEV